MAKLTELFASVASPTVYASAFQAAVEQIQAALGTDVEASLRAQGQYMLDLADLVHELKAGEMPPEMKKKMDKEMEDKKDEKDPEEKTDKKG